MSDLHARSPADVTLAILAGGAGSRMGTAKGSLLIRGQPILEYLLNGIIWPGPTMLVTAPGREHPPGWRRFDREVQDPPGGGGPLRGILTALEQLQTPLLVVLPVDMPEVRLPQLQFLVDELARRQKCSGLLLRRMLSGAQQVEPFPSALRHGALETIGDRLAAGKASVHRLADDASFQLIDAPLDWPFAMWTNLNSPADLALYVHARPQFR